MSKFVKTKCSLLKKDAETAFESVNFVSYKAKTKSKMVNGHRKDILSDEPKSKPVDMRKLRFEVIKFGTSGMDPGKKEASSIAMAVALGAKPPKNKYKNYKDILKEKREHKKILLKQGQFKNRYEQEPVKPSKRHLYVVGDKVIPAKSRDKDDVKNFLENYGKPGKPQIGKGFKRKRRS